MKDFSDTRLLRGIYDSLEGRLPGNMSLRVERLLDSVGDGSGTTEMATDADEYYIKPGAGQIFVLTRINIYIEDGVNEKFSAAKYGGTAALSNGIEISVHDSNGRLVTLTPQPVKVIGHWDLVAGVDMVLTDMPAGSSDFCAVRWTFAKGGGPLWLNGNNGEFLLFNVRDDLGAGGAALVSHLAQVQGKQILL